MEKPMRAKPQMRPKRLISQLNPPRTPKLSPRWVQRELARIKEIGSGGRRAVIYELAMSGSAKTRSRAQKDAISYLKSKFGPGFVPRKDFAVGRTFREWETAMRKISAHGYRSLSHGEVALVLAMVQACRWQQRLRAGAANKQVKIAGKQKH